jgi:ribosomal protein L22
VGQVGFWSVGAKDFIAEMQKLHEQIKGKLRNSSQRYKNIIYQRKKEVNIEIRDQFFSHMRKEIFPRGKYNKLKMIKIRPCKILRKFVANAYEIELPEDIGISLIFNIVDLYSYNMDET